MAIRYWPSDFTKAAQEGCAACSGVQEDVIGGDLRVESGVGRLPGKAVWPQLGCLYRSTDTGSSPFGVGRSAGGLLGIKVVAESGNTSNANVYDETGELAYYTYSGGTYTNQTGGLNRLYPRGTGWLLERSVGLYFQFDSAGKVIAGHDPTDNTLYFGYDGSDHYQKVLSHETGLAVYFETDGWGRVTSVVDWGGRETTLGSGRHTPRPHARGGPRGDRSPGHGQGVRQPLISRIARIRQRRSTGERHAAQCLSPVRQLLP